MTRTRNSSERRTLADECPRCEAPNAHNTRYSGSCDFDLKQNPREIEEEVWTRDEVEAIVAYFFQAALKGEPGETAGAKREDALGSVEAATEADANTAAGPFVHRDSEWNIPRGFPHPVSSAR